MRLLVRLLAAAAALGVATWLIDGVDVTATSQSSRITTLLIVAAIFGVLNAVVRPILTVLSLPLVIVTLGLFLLVVNGVMLMLLSWISGALDLAFEVTGLWPAVLGAVVISVVSFLIDVVLPDEYER